MVLPGLATVVGDVVVKSIVFSERKVKSPGVDALGILVRVVMLGELPRSGYEIESRFSEVSSDCCDSCCR